MPRAVGVGGGGCHLAVAQCAQFVGLRGLPHLELGHPLVELCDLGPAVAGRAEPLPHVLLGGNEIGGQSGLANRFRLVLADLALDRLHTVV
jgi:hypothetical protein